MANKKLRWYNYAAKVVMLSILTVASPLLILIGMAMGESPLWFYKVIWNEGTGKE